jgi:hypothetical protein
MAPEQLAGEAADARSDLFSFCVSLWGALYGERPFAGHTVRELRAAIAEDRVRPPPAGAVMPERLRDVVLRGLRANASERPSSMHELIADLRRERAYEGLSRAERVLREAQEFFRSPERVRAVSDLAVSLLGGPLAGNDDPQRVALARPDLPLLQHVEISGRHLANWMDRFPPHRALISHLLERAGFTPDPDGIVRLDPGGWYPYVLLLVLTRGTALGPEALHEIGDAVARATLEGEGVPSDLPLSVETLRRVDLEFNREIRLYGKTLDQHEPPLRDAVGGRTYEKIAPRCIEVVSSRAARCDVTRGYLHAVVRHFGYDGTIEHSEGPCRDRGDVECRYRIRWEERS